MIPENGGKKKKRGKERWKTNHGEFGVSGERRLVRIPQKNKLTGWAVLAGVVAGSLVGVGVLRELSLSRKLLLLLLLWLWLLLLLMESEEEQSREVDEGRVQHKVSLLVDRRHERVEQPVSFLESSLAQISGKERDEGRIGSCSACEGKKEGRKEGRKGEGETREQLE